MIIIDLNQVMISNIMSQIGNHTNMKLEENMVRHMVLNSILSFKNKHKEYGELVIACDNTNVWRKQFFPYYKANRRKKQSSSELDWNSIFECLNKIREELKLYFPYRVIDVMSAEADDVIATLTFNIKDEDILILSGDKDFIQLHSNPRVKQFDPVRKKFVSHPDPKRYLIEHVLKGDSGDGVPNVLSNDDVFIVGDRQKPMTQKRINDFINTDEDKLDQMMIRNYHRNRKLIDLSYVPNEIQNSILSQFSEQVNKDRSKLLDYFMKNRLKNLMESIGDF